MVTRVPAVPLAGVKLLIAGACAFAACQYTVIKNVVIMQNVMVSPEFAGK
jgi:hypothetical protein